MPIYDYVCKECNHLFEEMAAVSDRHEPRVCPECGVQAGILRITPVNFHLPGNRLEYPGAAMKWEREHVRQAEKGKKKEQEMQNDLASRMY